MNGLAKLMGVFLGEFAKKKAKSDRQFRLVRPSARKEQLSSHWTEVYEI